MGAREEGLATGKCDEGAYNLSRNEFNGVVGLAVPHNTALKHRPDEGREYKDKGYLDVRVQSARSNILTNRPLPM